MTIETTKNTENKPFITVTEKAVKHMKKQLGDEQDKSIRLSVKNAALMLVGTEIDLKVEGLNRELQFNNPNVTDMCGCGSSFSVN